MKKHAILIQCHNHPEQINELIDVLPAGVFDFYIHVDIKSSIMPLIYDRSNVVKFSAVDVRWGQSSQVEATIRLMGAMRNPASYAYVHLISGADFVIKPPSFFASFFSGNVSEYIESELLDGTSTWAWGGVDRFQCYYPQWMIRRPADKLFRVVRVVWREFIMRTKVFKRRDQPVGKFYGGSSWWSLTGGCVDWMLGFLESHPGYFRFFKHGVCVDEVFFSTLIRYSPYSDNVVNGCLRYMRWNDEGNKSGGPSVLRQENIPEMLGSCNVFARKFIGLEVIHALERKIGNQNL